jgi:hypothetical protein
MVNHIGVVNPLQTVYVALLSKLKRILHLVLPGKALVELNPEVILNWPFSEAEDFL